METETGGMARFITHVNTGSTQMMRVVGSLKLIAELAASTIVGGVIGWVIIRVFGLDTGPVEASLIALGTLALAVSDYRRSRHRQARHSSQQPGSNEWSP